MKEPRKLSLQEELEQEAQQIKEEILKHPELENIQVTEEMDQALFEKIRAYEKEKAEEKAVPARETKPETKSATRSETKSEASTKKPEIPGSNATVEFSEELVPDMSAFSEYRKDEPEKKIPYRRKKTRYLMVSLAAVLILVLGLGMTSVGSKSYWKVLWEKIHGEEPIKFIDVEDMDEINSEDGDEVTTYRKIGEELGIVAVRIIYKPKGMKLDRYEIAEDFSQARLFYQYGEEIIRYTIYINDTDSSWGEKEEDTKVDEYAVEINGIEIQVEEYQVSQYSEYRQLADFEYRGVHYQLKGVMERAEFEKILKNLYFS